MDGPSAMDTQGQKGGNVDRLFYRVREFAAMAGISKSKAHELVASGRIKSVWLDAMLLIPADEVRAFVERVKAENGLTPTAA